MSDPSADERGSGDVAPDPLRRSDPAPLWLIRRALPRTVYVSVALVIVGFIFQNLTTNLVGSLGSFVLQPTGGGTDISAFNTIDALASLTTHIGDLAFVWAGIFFVVSIPLMHPALVKRRVVGDPSGMATLVNQHIVALAALTESLQRQKEEASRFEQLAKMNRETASALLSELDSRQRISSRDAWIIAGVTVAVGIATSIIIAIVYA